MDKQQRKLFNLTSDSLSTILTIFEYEDADRVFAKPVDTKIVHNYLEFIKQPMDISTIRQKLDSNQYQFLGEVTDDINLIFENCLKYNPPKNFFNLYGLRMKRIVIYLTFKSSLFCVI